MNKKLYVCDLDGTLAENGKKLDSDTVEMLNDVLDCNNKEFVISSARNYSSIKSRINGMNKNIKIIARNGSIIYDEQGNVIHKAPIDEVSVTEAINYAILQNLCPVIVKVVGNEERIYCDFKYMNEQTKKHTTNLKLENVKEYKDIKLKNVIGIYAFGDITKDYILREVLIRKDKDFLQITSMDATKGKALEYLKNLSNYDDVTCFGNDENDYSMLDIADNPYFVYDSIQNKKDKYNNIPWDNAKSIIQVIAKGGV